MQRHKDLIQESRKLSKKACLSTSSTSSQVRYYRYKRGVVVGTTRGGVRSRSSMQVSARKLAANFWKMNEMSLSEVMEEKKLSQRGENLSVVHSASVSHLSDHAPCGSVSQRMDRFIPSSHQRTASVSLEHKHLGPTVRAVDQHSSASLIETEISYRGRRTPREPIVGVRTRLKDINNALVTSKELLNIIDRILAHNDQRASSISLISALHSELERACLQVNQLIKEQKSDLQREMSYLFWERAAYNNKQQQAVEVAIESIAGELKAERKVRCQFESLNNKLGRELTETKFAFTNTTKELESEKKERKRVEQVCDKIASDIGQKEREHKILQLSRKSGGKKVHTKLSEGKDQSDEKNGAVEKLRNQLEAFFKSKKSEKTSCDKNMTYYSRTHFRSNKNEEKECGGELGESSAESDLHSVELNMDNKRGSFKWTHASTAARDILLTEDEMRANKSISEIVPRRSNYILGSVSDGFQSGIHSRTTPSSVNFLQQERFYGLNKKSQRKGDKCELLRHKSVKDLKEKILSSSSLESGGEFTSPIQGWAQPLHSQCFANVVEERTCSMQRLSTKSRLGEIGAEGQQQRRIRR
ncbi:hypothetical protein POM88_004293 [Heracleum sosnowskyi]|uniref:Uncharacterized protein n=1 Tax=Heracleum sosnowskyi TaxID=360622 RepID=A0AAD8NEC7_9APIA|nr:hypothetical protein POM88_004293 [Heracleum sosnowskyi]